MLRTEIRERLRRSRDWAIAIDELEREAEGIQNERERSELLFELGNLTEEVVPERDRALAIYQRAWKLAPENVKALTRAREIYGELGRQEMVAKVGEIELKLRQGDIAAGHLAELVGEAMLDCGMKDKALPILQMALAALPDSSRVKDALAAANYDPEAWLDDVERLSNDAQRVDASTAARMLLRAARIVHIETPDDPTYEALLEKTLGNDPQNESANFLYEDLLSRTERWTDLEAHHLRRAAAAASEYERAALCRRFALEWVQRFKDRERGARFFAKAIQAATGNGSTNLRSIVAAFLLLRDVYGARNEWREVLTLADAALASTTGEQKLYIAIQAANIAWQQMSDASRAREYYAIVRALEPGHPDLQDFEQSAPAGSNPTTDVVPVVEMDADEPDAPGLDGGDEPEIEVVGAPQAEGKKGRRRRRAAVSSAPPPVVKVPADPDLVRSARPAPSTIPTPVAPVREEDLSGDVVAAIEHARGVEADSPDRAIDAYRKIIAANPNLLAPRREYARVLRTLERWPALIEALKDAESKAAQTTPEKVELLTELVSIYRKVRNELMAVNTLNHIHELQPDNTAVLDQLAEQYESSKRWPDLVKVLAAKAPHVVDQRERVALFLRIANLYIERFSNQAEAIKAFEQVLDIDPDNAEAIHHLLDVYGKRRDWEKLIKLREREVDRTQDPAERAEKVYEVAKLAATKVKKPEICQVWWAKVLETDPGHEEAITELEKLYERSKEWDKLAEICNKKAFIASDAKAQVEALQKLGLLYQDKLEDNERAIDAWRRLLDIEPEHRRAQDSIKKLYVTKGSWAELEQFYRGQGKLDEFVRVLERQLETEGVPNPVGLAMQIAVLYRDELDKGDRAMRAFEKVLSLDENNLEAAEALIPLYEQGRDPRKLVRALEIQLAQTGDGSLRQERLQRLAEYNEDKLRDKGAAFGWWLKAHAEDHASESIRAQVERLSQETGAWPELVDAYVSSYRKFDDRADALPLMLVVARVQESELGEIDAALATNRAILGIDPSNEHALSALERLYLGKQMYAELLGVYEKKLELTMDGDLRTQIQYKIGQLYEDEIRDDAKAVAAYEGILEQNADDLSALGALDRIFGRNQKWRDLGEVLERQIILVDPEDDKHRHVDLKYRLGQLREDHLGATRDAIDCYREILSIAPHPGARAALERRLSDAQHKQEAAGILEPIYEQLGEWSHLIQVHEIQLGASEDRLRRVGLLMRVGELHSKHLGDAESAFGAFARAFSEDPGTEGAKRELEELCGLLDDGWPKLVHLYEEALERDDIDPPLAHELSLKVARAYEQRLDNTEKAVEYYRRSLQIEPDDVDAIVALEMIFERDERYPELLDVYRKKVDIAGDADERLRILARIASLYEDVLGNQSDAIEIYNEILSHDGENDAALRALDRLYAQAQQWQELADNLGRQLVLTDSDRIRVELLGRLAALRETQLAEVAAAVETYRQVLDIDRDNMLAIQALERLITQPDHELTIAQILEPIYEATGNWERQIAVYEIMARHAYDPERKLELYEKIGERYEICDAGAEAFDTYARAFREEPRSDAAQSHLDRLARLLDRWQDLIVLYDDVVNSIGDEDLKVQLLTRLAYIHERELRDDQSAVATYERVLAIAPNHVDSASAIQIVHERNGDYAALVGILKRKSEMLVDLNARKGLLYKAAQIEEEVLQQPTAAIETYKQVLELDDIDDRAMNELEKLFLNLQMWEPYKDIYTKRAELVEDPRDKVQMLHVLGQVYDQHLGDVSKAIDTYQAILDIDDAQGDAVEALDRLYEQAGRWYDLLGILERQVELAAVSGQQVGLKYRIGKLWQEKLTDLARSIESYNEALQIDPQHPETLDALDGLLHSEEGEPVMAARVLEPLYEASGEYEKLVDVLEVMVKHAEDPIAKVELLQRIAELYEFRLERHVEAFQAHARALREDNGNELSLAHLERLADMIGGWQAVAELYSAEADKSLDVPRQVDLLSRLARVYEQELQRGDQAIRIYRRILDVEFDNRPAVLALDRLYTQYEKWTELTDILRKEIQLADSDADTVNLQFRLGQVLEQQLRDLPAAIDVYREILTAHADHVSTRAALEMMFLEGQHELEIAGILEPLYESAGEFEKLHRIHEVQLSKLSDPVDRQSMYQRLAELAETRLYDQPRAFAWWGSALCEDPGAERPHEEAERLAREGQMWPDLANVYIQVLERHAEPDARRQALLRLARVYDAEMGEPASAVETYLHVLEIDEKDPDALGALDRLYLNAGMYDELVEILRRRIEIVLDGDEIIQLQLRRGQIFAEALGDLDSALACYQQVLEQESRNRPALEAEEQIYFRREAWRELFGVYEKLVDVADGDRELSAIYASMAKLASDALNDEEGAIEQWNKVLDIRGEDPQALSALGDLYGRRAMWDELVEVLERAVNVSKDPVAKVDLYKRLGRVWSDKLGRERNSLDAWLRAYELDSNDLQTLQALAQLYRATQAWEELSSTLQRIIEVGQLTGQMTEDQLIELYAQLGQLEGEMLGRVNEAVEAWRRVLSLDPGDFRALNALEHLFKREARWEECIEVLERRALVLEDPQAKIDTLLEAGALWEERVDNLDAAAEVYERIRLELDPHNRKVSERLEEIYQRQYKWEKLNEILLDRVGFTEDTVTRIELLQKVARVYEEELGNQEDAFVVLQEAFKEDFSYESTAKELERLATATGRWHELLSDYSVQVESLESENPEKAANLWVKIGRWYADQAQHVDYAIHSVQQALRINQNHLGAMSALADFQRRRGSWHELVEVLQRHASIEPSGERKVELYLNLAQQLEERLRDPFQAMQAYQKAVEADASSMDALVSLERLYRQHQMWEPLIDVLDRIATLRTDSDDVVRLRLEIGQLLDERIVDAVRSIRAYREVLETDAHNLPALRALEQLYEKTGQSEQYLDTLEAQLDASPSDAEQISLYERMASAWEERFGKLDRAAEALEKIVSIDMRNFGAYRELARLYRLEAKWDSLVDVYRRHIGSTTDVRARIDLYCAMGEVYEEELRDYDGAIDAYQNVLQIDSDEARALDALGRNFERIEEWHRAIEVMTQLVQIAPDPAQQVDLYHRIGRITFNKLNDVERGEQYFVHTLTINQAHVPTMEELVKLYAQRGDWLKAAQMMVRAESYTVNVIDKLRLLNEAAKIYLERLKQPDQAKQYLAAVIALDPEHVEAGEPLSELYFKAGQWQELSPLLDMLVRKSQGKDALALKELYYRTAKTADELREFEKALHYYKLAYDIDSTYLPVLVGRADLLFNMQDWEGAGKIYQTILVQHRDSQNEGDVVRTYYRLGMVRQNLGERRKALNMFEKALEIDPHHPDTLNAVIAIQEQQGDWEAVIHAKRAIVAKAQVDTAIQLLDEVGEIYREKLNNPQKAIGAFHEALELRPSDHQLLQKVLDLYTDTEQWKKAVEVIEKFISLEKDPLRRGSYYQAAGTICRDKLKSTDEAIELYNQALDNFFIDGMARIPSSFLPRALKAFADIDKILTTKRDWKEQERAYRKMIKRLKPGDKILTDLWHALGEIYRSRLKQYESATAAFEVAQQLDPENTQRREILAELYLLSGPDHADKAILQHMEMLKVEPFKYDSYKALRRIYMDTHQYDKTWCVCNALTFLKKADAEEMQFFEQYKQRQFVKAKQRMTEEVWRKVTHPDENPYVGAIFAAIWQGAAMIRAQPHKAFGLRRKDKRQIETDQLQFSKIFYYVGQVLNVSLPDVYLRPEEQGDIAVANTQEKGKLIPSFVVRANLLSGRPEREIAFAAARWLTFMRPDHYLKLALPTNTELKTAFLTAIHMVKPQFPIPTDMQALVAQYLPAMQKQIQPAWLEQLSIVVNRFIQTAPEVNLSKWGHAVDATSHRVGFVVCGDLEVAARMVSMEPVVVGGPQVKDKIKELVLYSISEDYFAVRSHLGLTIG